MTGGGVNIQTQRSEDFLWGKRLFAVLFMIGIYYGIQLLTHAFAIYPYLGLPADWTQHGNWVQMIDHHLWQMVLALVVIFVLSRGQWQAWGFNLWNLDESLRLLKKFFLYYGLYFVGIGWVIQFLFSPRPQPAYPLTAANIVGMLVFKGVLSGLSEEILFRGMMQTYFQRYFTGVWTWKSVELPTAGIVTAVIFTLVHINFRLFPFEITHLYPPQLMLAFVLGLYYASTYHRTGSLLNPILAHNFSNTTLYLSELALLWLK